MRFSRAAVAQRLLDDEELEEAEVEEAEPGS